MNPTDFSANKPANIPTVGTAFSASGVYSSFVRVALVPANPSRTSIAIENNCGAAIAIVVDDGAAAEGTAMVPARASVFTIDGGAAAGGQGGSWNSQTEKGRIQIYALSSSAQVMAREA